MAAKKIISRRFRQWKFNRKLHNKREERFSLKRFFDDQFMQHPPRIILSSFAVIILFGTILLSLPQASAAGTSLPLVDALFTATSATCVTGLIVVDTGGAFSTFGQLVILILIQIGGLGIMTFSTFFVYIISGRLAFSEREILIDTLSQNPAVELIRLLKIVFLFTIVIETMGWIILTLRFLSDYSLSEAIYQGLFHAVSAFCNAGFSLFPGSFVRYVADPVINLVLVTLITLGGLGFMVIYDIYKNRKHILKMDFFNLSLHSRVVLLSSALLVLAGSVVFLGLEFSNSLVHLPFPEKILASFFHSVTTRTAGFNTLSVEQFTNSTLFLIIILMFIGASPGSCGGGIKTTTMMLLMLSLFARFRSRDKVSLFYRRIPDATLSRMISVIFFSAAIVIFFTFVLLISETLPLPHTQTRGRFLEIFFEVVSAFGTVGLSTGITAGLTSAGKIVITLLMFIGRLGPLTIALAIGGKIVSPDFKYMQEDVMIG